jgi:hypothetical protein
VLTGAYAFAGVLDEIITPPGPNTAPPPPEMLTFDLSAVGLFSEVSQPPGAQV